MKTLGKWFSSFLRLNILFIILTIFNFTSSSQEPLPQTLFNKEICQEQTKKNSFSWEDYLVLGIVLVISCGVGVFYGCFNKNKNSKDFLLGGSSMGTFPMAMSLAASFITAIELLGNPAEMYTHGAQFWMICICFLILVPLTSKFYLPVFLELRLTSSYEYLALRFTKNIRYLASGLYILQMVLYTSVAVYAPALALTKVTGLNVYIAVTAVYVVCIFYASQGGMKAVIIADTFQAAVLIGSLLLIAVIGHNFVGGAGIIWSQSYTTGRLEIFDFNPNMTVRHSFWSVVIGGTFYWMTMFCSNQASIQKYLSVESIGQVRKAIWTSSIGLILIYSINFYTGMIMVANYRECDPLTNGEISATDEILPYYIITVMGHMRGLTGFFVAGIFAASLGTVASALNSLAAVTMEDFIESALKIKIPENRGALIAKSLSIGYGALSFGLVFLVANCGSVMQIAISFNGMVGGVTLGLFTLGMMFPWANSKGALVGSTIAAALITFMCVGQQVAIANGQLGEEMKPTSITNCSCLNTTYKIEPMYFIEREPVFLLYRISYIWYSGIGLITTILIGLIISLLTKPTRLEDLDDVYISPPIRKLLYSLSDGTKKFLNVPVKKNFPKNNIVKEMTIKIDQEEYHEIKQNNFNEQIKNKIRKISAPS
ncbi:sodium-coupled monocarboxylate transporter 2-like isoform X1 [Diabrotica undecimpunctata]|uniref:sodium-coupled monocarboxylate transporter 2-like isoform X1 n=1 Tax=Diabrotica undecimpunctata TaxID=50387 RepID=UPI003B64113F